MPAGTSLGEGIGLQSKPYDNRWMERLASDRAREDAARAKGDKELFKDSDFVATKGNFLPPYQKAIVALEKDMMNKIAQTRQGGRYVNQAQARQIMYDYKNRINQYVVNNDLAKKYLERKDIMHDQEVLGALTSTDSDITTIAELTQTNPFVRVGADGAFNYYPVPNKQVDYKFGDPDMVGSIEEKRSGRYKYIRETLDYSPEALAKASENISADPAWAMQTLMRAYKNDPETFSKQPNENQEQYFKRISPLLAPMADEEAMRLKPPAKLGPIKEQVLYGLSSGGGAAREKYKAPVQYDVKATVFTGKYDKGEEIMGRDKQGNFTVPTGKYEQVPKYGEATRPISMRLNPKMQAFTVSTSEGIIDANTNQRIPKKSYNFTFKPDHITVIKRQADGTYKKYVQGTVVRPLIDGSETATEISYSKTDDGKEIQEKTSKLLIPYDDAGVRSAIEAENDLTEFNAEYDKLSATQPAKSTQAQQSKRNTITRAEIKQRIKGSGYTEDEYIKLLKDRGVKITN